MTSIALSKIHQHRSCPDEWVYKPKSHSTFITRYHQLVTAPGILKLPAHGDLGSATTAEYMKQMHHTNSTTITINSVTILYSLKKNKFSRKT
jgi:hypothetical protein